MLELDRTCAVQCTEAFFASLPEQPAVFLLESADPAATPYLGRTANLRRALRRLLEPAVETAPPRRQLTLAGLAVRLHYRLTGSRFEQSWVVYHHARRLFPRDYRQRLRLRPPVLIKLRPASPYPRCQLARQVRDDGAVYFGPFPSLRFAAQLNADLLGLFRIRRCHLRIVPDPAFPGCIYSEMKQCLAPCYGGCTAQEYAAEVERVVAFWASRGSSLAAPLEQERAEAAAREDYERAGAVQRKLERVAQVVRRLPELVRVLDRLEAVLLQPSAQPAAVEVFRVHAGALGGPFRLDFAALSSQPRSTEALLRDWLEAPPPNASPEERTDQLALLARWFYSHPRQGEIFFREGAPGGGWPYRRIVRGCARVLGPAAELPFGAAHPRSEPA